MVNPNMEWYLLAGMSDIPQIDVRLKDQPERGVDRHRRAADGADGRGDRARGPECDRRDDAEPAADAGEDPAGAAAGTRGVEDAQ